MDKIINSHEIDYKIYGNDLQYVEVTLDPGESVIAEAGTMMVMDQFIEMETIFGDGSAKDQGLMGSLIGAGKRLLTGAGLFMTMFTNRGHIKQNISFAAPFPGKILPIDLSATQNQLLCQKDSFLCAAKGVSVGVAFTRKLGAGFFGGEGFILQKLEGDGMTFIHACGGICKKILKPDEVIKVEAGCIVAMTKDIDYDIELVRGIKSMVFGGEGLFFATLRGPGAVLLQSAPLSRLADRLYAATGVTGGSNQEQSGFLGDLGNLL